VVLLPSFDNIYYSNDECDIHEPKEGKNGEDNVQ